MIYYELCILKSPISNLTYQSNTDITIGYEVLVSLKTRKKLCAAVILKKVDKPSFKCVEIKDITSFYYDTKMIEIATFISKYYVCSLGEALSIYVPFNKDISFEKEYIQFDSNIKLSLSQEKAYNFLEEKKQALLFANTGSGKTEIYIKAIEKVLNQNEQALLLMPEISLSPQMKKRLEKVFGDKIAIWHSKITKKQKAQTLEHLLNGQVSLIAGARSALFLPFKNLKIIVVDEEHDESYKSDQKPRYNAKDLALYIAKKYDIKLILGSATASISSFYKIPYFILDETFHKSKKIINFDNSSNNLSPAILNKITQTLNNNHQIIVFVPTRANFKYQICTSCGKAVECPYCSVSMSLHKNDLALKCHYCNFAQIIPSSCPSCISGNIGNLRVGTAQIEEELNAIFKNIVIKRFDTDEIRTHNKLKQVLGDFNKNKIDILVGTQMLSKGHDYHNVKLAIVFGIDSILNMTSYKARERALSLLIQISGRIGRKGEGEVIIQSKNEEFFSYYLQKSTYKEFLEEELHFRKGLYPPFVKIARIIFAHTNGLKVKKELDFFVHLLKQNENIEVIGFGQCVVFKISNKFRYEIILRSNNIKALLLALHSINSSISSIDMDTLY